MTENEDGVARDGLPSGVAIGLLGLEQAIPRIHDAIPAMFSGKGAAPISAAVGEALLWVGTLDDHFASEVPSYFAQRDSDECGRTVAGLVYARNLKVHGLHAAGVVALVPGRIRVLAGEEARAHKPGRGTLFSFQFGWAELEALPRPNHRETHGRDAAYAERVAGRQLTNPFDDALGWFRQVSDGQT